MQVNRDKMFHGGRFPPLPVETFFSITRCGVQQPANSKVPLREFHQS